jgi:peptidoglycan hydrolase-like protein with peptidoglycan-binding domain
MRLAAKALIGLVAIVAIAGTAFVLTQHRTDAQATTTTMASRSAGREFTAVQVQNLSDTKSFDATVGYGSEWALPFTASGTVTERHDAGTIVEAGEPVIWINTRPLFFAEGTLPLYRELQRATIRRPGVKAHPLSGDDVAQLQRFLLSQGFDDKGRLEEDGVFGKETERAVKDWQKANDLDQTGTVTGAYLVFSPTSVRLQSAPRVGSKFDGMQVTSPDQEIIIRTGRRDVAYLKKGAAVQIQIGQDDTMPGTVTRVEEVHDQDSGQTLLKATITAAKPLSADLAAVTVVGTGVAVENALTVPVRALVALSEGGYALEVQTGPDTTELRTVEVGEVLQGFAVVTGDVTADDRVVVPE